MVMVQRLSAFLVAILVGCATNSSIERKEWSASALSVYSHKLDEISGANAIDCGVYDFVSKNRAQFGFAIRECIEQSINAKQPFKLGTINIAGDVYLHKAVILSPENEFWLIALAVSIDGSDSSLRAEKCQSLKLEYTPLFYNRESCEKVNVEKWHLSIK